MRNKATFRAGRQLRKKRHPPIADWSIPAQADIDDFGLEFAERLADFRTWYQLCAQLVSHADVRYTLRELLKLDDATLAIQVHHVDQRTHAYLATGIVRYWRARNVQILSDDLRNLRGYAPTGLHEIIRHALDAIPRNSVKRSSAQSDSELARFLFAYWRAKGLKPTLTRDNCGDNNKRSSDFVLFAIDIFARVGRRLGKEAVYQKLTKAKDHDAIGKNNVATT